MSTGWRAILMAVAVAVAQIGFLGWMINGRAEILRSGREVLLKVQPVDPRDLLRGDYVRLGYEAAQLPRDIIAGLPADATPAGGRIVFVRFARGVDKFWTPVSANVDAPAANRPDDQIDLRAVSLGYETSGSDGRKIVPVDYGIERFYVPEGEGLAIERDMRVRSFAILAAVTADGIPQIKGLMDGDVMIYEEPLY
jgi:uncharacterized membrane-anchored protein